MNNSVIIRLTPYGVTEKLKNLFLDLYDNFPTGPHIVALTAPAMSGKSETVARFLQSLITEDTIGGARRAEGYHWKALRTHDRDHPTLALARARPRPSDRKAGFYWFATGADCTPGEMPGGVGFADNPWSVLAKQLEDSAVYKQVPRLVIAKEGFGEFWKNMEKIAANVGLEAAKSGSVPSLQV